MKDSKLISLGSGFITYYGALKYKNGATMDELDMYLDDLIEHTATYFVVNDLTYLHRGGRVSKSSAVLGGLIGIKPILHVDDEGHLINVAKARGRKASLQALAAKLGELGDGFDNSTVFISHGDCLADAELLRDTLKKEYGKDVTLITWIGSVIGAHSGPGTLALFFLGTER